VWQPPPTALIHVTTLHLRPATAAVAPTGRLTPLAGLVMVAVLALTGASVAVLGSPTLRERLGRLAREATGGARFTPKLGVITRAELDGAAGDPTGEGRGVVRKRVLFRGNENASGEGEGCRGLRETEPAVSLRLDAPRIVRITLLDASAAALQLRDDQGRVIACSPFIADPAVIVRRLEPGTYHVFPTAPTPDEHIVATLEVAGIEATGDLENGFLPSAAPRSGVIDLGETSERELGGQLRVEVETAPGDRCGGVFGMVPDVRIDTRFPRAVRIDARPSGQSEDLVLRLRRPDGSVACNDARGTNEAHLTLGLPPGSYPVWAGSRMRRLPGEQGLPFRLRVRSIPIGDGRPGADGFIEGGTPSAGTIDLDDPRSVRRLIVPVRPWLDARRLGGGCGGHVAPLRDVVVWTSRPRVVRIRTRSDEDSVLVMRDPAGVTRCDDDSGGRRNALLEALLPPGETSVWVGLTRPERELGRVGLEVEALDR
jgi:PAS domain-containing protein